MKKFTTTSEILNAIEDGDFDGRFEEACRYIAIFGSSGITAAERIQRYADAVLGILDELQAYSDDYDVCVAGVNSARRRVCTVIGEACFRMG